MSVSSNATVEKHRAAGLCNCGRTPREDARVCAVCTEKQRVWYASRKAAGKCNCGNDRVAGKSACVACRARALRYREERRRELVAAYGGACRCCGETETTFLAIDHVFNDGAQERREGPKGGNVFFSRLKKLGFPRDRDRYQLLCHNCNFAKRLGPCPHKAKPACGGSL